MTRIARGTFDVKLRPDPITVGASDPPLGRLALDKRFHGDLDGASLGQMLAARSATPGSAGYVAMELVRATLEGRTGTFVLQHSGTMDRGEASLTVTVVPDSGTGGLVGLSGRMHILVSEGRHDYEFTYDLA